RESARLVDRDIIEGGDAVDGVPRQRAAENRAAWTTRDRERNGGSRRADGHACRVLNADLDRRSHGRPGRRGSWLDDETDPRRGRGYRRRTKVTGAVVAGRGGDNECNDGNGSLKHGSAPACAPTSNLAAIEQH